MKKKKSFVLNESLDDSDSGYVTTSEEAGLLEHNVQRSDKRGDKHWRDAAQNVKSTSKQLIKGYSSAEPVTSATPLNSSAPSSSSSKRVVYTKQLLRRYMLWVIGGWLALVVLSVIIMYGWRVAYDIIEDEGSTFLDDDYNEADKTDLYYITTNCTAGNDFDITLTRSGYDPLPYFPSNDSVVLSYAFLRSYGGVVEPHGPMHLHVFGADSVDNTDADYYYKYRIYDSSYSPVAHAEMWPSEDYKGTVTMQCNPHDEYKLAVLKYGFDGLIRGGAMEDVVCMYVRREVRELSADDLSAALDAMHALWAYSDDEGQAKYGEAFYSSNYFAEAHNFNAAWKDADHIHEGALFSPLLLYSSS